jgi:hypothetical protein
MYRLTINRWKNPGMNPLEHRILEVLQASCDGHSTAFNVFNVLNTNGYNVTKHEFEGACKQLHDCTCITYRPIRTSLIDIPIGTLDLLTKSPALSLFSKGANSALGIETLEDSTAEPSTIGKIRCELESETQPKRAGPTGKPLETADLPLY